MAGRDTRDIVVVGAGHGGAQAAIALRQLGFAGSVAVIGNGSEFPYERPPLSKEYFAGDKTFDRILIRPAAFWAERKVEMLLSTEVSAVDARAKRLSFANGGAIALGRPLGMSGALVGRLKRSGGRRGLATPRVGVGMGWRWRWSACDARIHLYSQSWARHFWRR